MRVLHANLRLTACVSFLTLTACFMPSPVNVPPSSPPAELQGPGNWRLRDDGFFADVDATRGPDGTLYFSSARGLKAVDEKSGVTRWTSQVTQDRERTLVARDTIYAYSAFIGADDQSDFGYIRALDSRTGTQRWRVGKIIGTSAPVLAGNILWALNTAGEVISIDIASGKFAVRESYRNDTTMRAYPGLAMTSYADILLFGLDAGVPGVTSFRQIQGRNDGNAKFLWTRDVYAPMKKTDLPGSPVWIGVTKSSSGLGVVAVADEYGMTGYNAATGGLLWIHKAEFTNLKSMTFRLIGDQMLWSESAGTTQVLHAMDAGTGDEKWKLDGFHHLQDQAIIQATANSTWVVATAERVTVISPDGQKLATLDTPDNTAANDAANYAAVVLPRFATDGEYGYVAEDAHTAWGDESLVVFRLRTGEATRRIKTRHIKHLAFLNGRLLLLIDGVGLVSMAPPHP